MRHTVYKLFWAWQHEEEEKWLNEMSAQGLQLVSVVAGVRYTFEEGEEGEYIYRLEMLEKFPSNYESIKYIRFIEETGAEYISSYMKWVYFRKKAADGKFEIYSDIQSKIRHFNRIRSLSTIVIPMNVFPLFLNISNFINFGSRTALFAAILSSSVSIFLTFGVIQLSIKINKLKKEEFLRE